MQTITKLPVRVITIFGYNLQSVKIVLYMSARSEDSKQIITLDDSDFQQTSVI